MKANEAAQIAEEAQIRGSHEHTTVLKIIKVHASNGLKEISLPMSSVSKACRTILEKDGYNVTYTFQDAIIKW